MARRKNGPRGWVYSREGVRYAIVAGSPHKDYSASRYGTHPNNLAKTLSEAKRKLRAVAQFWGSACMYKVPSDQRRMDRFPVGRPVMCASRRGGRRRK